MRRTAAFLCIAGAATALLLAHATFGEQPGGASPTPVEKSTPAATGAVADVPADGNLPDAMIDEIRRIRRRLDIDLLKGSSLETTPEKSPGEPTDETAAKQETTSPQTDDDAEFADTLRKFAPRLAERHPAAADRVFYQGDSPSAASFPSEQPFVASLQAAARQLALRAEVLEDRREYAAADRLRRLARRLRRETRQLSP